MAEAAPAPEIGAEPTTVLHVTRTFAAPRERVFRAWTEPEAVRRWFGVELNRPQSVESDLRPGGRYRYTFKRPLTGRIAHCVGTYLEVEPPQRLVYTFGWEGVPLIDAVGESKVTVDFRERGDSTEVALTQELIDKFRFRSYHSYGWNRSMAALKRYLQADS
jgi:uncharacterized protein YndB with AHSA1/START domain